MHKPLTAVLFTVASIAALVSGTAMASAAPEAAISYKARFCSGVQEGNAFAVQVNTKKESDYPSSEYPEESWIGSWVSNATFETWVERVTTAPMAPVRSMWCHTHVRSDLSVGDFVRLSIDPSRNSDSMAVHLFEVVEKNGEETERLLSEFGGVASRASTFLTIPTPVIPEPMEPTPTTPPSPEGGSSAPRFGSS